MIPIQIIQSALTLLPPSMSSPEAFAMLGAIGLQESEWIYRQQIGGPAHSFMMFEEGGIRALASNTATTGHVQDLCDHFGIVFSVGSIYDEILTNDALAICLGRLLLFSDAAPLPALGDGATAWQYYVRNWRPGRPRPQDWPSNYQEAMAAWTS